MRRGAALLTALFLLASAACGGGRAPRSGPRPLPADSAAMLERAVKRARPAFATQDEALRAGAYRMAVEAAPPVPEQAEPAPLPPAPAAAAVARPEQSVDPAFVIQIAAFRDVASAQVAAGEARRSFADLEVRVEHEGGLFRVALAAWPSAEEAQRALERVRVRYPTAWVRPGSLP